MGNGLLKGKQSTEEKSKPQTTMITRPDPIQKDNILVIMALIVNNANVSKMEDESFK